ncbi:MAG TPA: hypothetical protein VGZ22_11335 [Isosphaeraceae bacterium]|jgi:hypothetical protein|nr:hypothetical protein [Isosphaeraceae bacterium]
MKGHRWLVPVLFAVAAMPGCQASQSRRAALAPAEPSLVTAGEGGSTIVEAPPKSITFVDRHPLFSKPREFYDNSGNNKVVKAAAATVVGVPAGIVGELRQIVIGQPPGTTY